MILQSNSIQGYLVDEDSTSHTFRHTHEIEILRTSGEPVAQAATYTIHDKHKRRTTMSSVGFELRVPSKHAGSDLMATGFGTVSHMHGLYRIENKTNMNTGIDVEESNRAHSRSC